jgi:alpha-tubulin suppressor-like RCC1 family protein
VRWLIAIAIAGCSGPTVDGTACSGDGECNLFNVRGTCETTGFCSYPDSTCTEGRRYAPGAGDELGGTCLGGELACGHLAEACCGVDTCGPDLACTAGRCSCGAAGEPCCGGASCGVGLACGDGACSSAAVEQVAVGVGHVCALRSDSSVWCWGFDFKPFPFSAPGAGVSVIESAKPAPIPGAIDFVELRAGDHHTCGKKSDNTLACWGHNERGQLGDGTQISTPVPVTVTGLTNVTQFDAGRIHTCALGSFQGTAGLWCWGRNGEKGNAPNSTTNPNLGRLGNGTTADSLTPVAVDLSQVTAGGATIKAMSAGGYHSCVVASNNKVWCWGRNNQGQLGDGSLVDTKAPVAVDLSALTIPNGVTIDEVSCGRDKKKEDSTCLRMSNGTIACWGNGTFGELGDGGIVDHTKPTTTVVAGTFAAKPTRLASGQNARCALTDAGTVFCWGRNQNGLLGAGLTSFGNFSLPVKANTTGTIKQLSMSHHTACAVDSDGAVWCWGTNTRAQAKARLPKDQTDRATINPFRITF